MPNPIANRSFFSTVLINLTSLFFILNLTACNGEPVSQSEANIATAPTSKPLTPTSTEASSVSKTATTATTEINAATITPPQKQASPTMHPLAQKRPIYNQAYQENYDADSLETILQSARNAYVLIDPFQLNTEVDNSIAAIKAKSNQVGCYISVGTGENWRKDFAQMQPYLVKKQWGEWEGEYFIKDTTTGVLDIMKARVDKMAIWGCDWVEFDNMDWTADDDYREEYKFTATLQDSVDYVQQLCQYVKDKQMQCMAKNTVDHYEDFDGVLYESYHDEKNWWGQGGTQQFLEAGKVVIINHYNEAHCDQIYAEYKAFYNDNISFICEDLQQKKYRHYNQS